ncbi:MAG: TonB-dependent receptor, partial [Bacteroidota bacterium]
AQLTAGSFGLVTGEFSQRADRYTVYGGIRRLGGYRESSDRQYARIGASYDVLRSATRRLTASTLHSLRNYDDPGALTGEQVEADRRQQALPFRFDGLDERTHRIGLDGRQTTAWGKARVAFAADYRAADLLRTLPLAATFFDTKRRETEAGRLFASVQTEFGNLPLGGRFIVGVDGTLGQLDSEYRLVNLGPPEAYLGELDPESGEIDRDGNATRRALAGFAQLDLNPADAIRITLGARADGLSDRYTPDVPSDGETLSTDNSAISPKVGINVRYAQTATQLGRLYVSASRSFKAPTLDQLYDQRTYFFSPEIPPITISNGELKPQTGVGIEAGAYHRVELSRDVAVEASVSAYRIDMENELDFSFEILRFVNVAESRHDGIEVGLKAYGPRGLSVFGNWTRQDVTFANGPNEGNAVKAIPRDFFSGGVTGEIARGVFGSLLVTSAQTIFLDDANVVRLPDYTVANLRLGYRIGGAELLLNLYNVLDASYSATGFPDPAGSDVAFFYPAAGRTFEAGLRLQLR